MYYLKEDIAILEEQCVLLSATNLVFVVEFVCKVILERIWNREKFGKYDKDISLRYTVCLDVYDGSSCAYYGKFTMGVVVHIMESLRWE